MDLQNVVLFESSLRWLMCTYCKPDLNPCVDIDEVVVDTGDDIFVNRKIQRQCISLICNEKVTSIIFFTCNKRASFSVMVLLSRTQKYNPYQKNPPGVVDTYGCLIVPAYLCYISLDEKTCHKKKYFICKEKSLHQPLCQCWWQQFFLHGKGNDFKGYGVMKLFIIG